MLFQLKYLPLFTLQRNGKVVTPSRASSPQVMDEQYQTVPVRLTEKTPGVFRADYTPCTGGRHTVQVRCCITPLHRRQTYCPGEILSHTPAPVADILSR